MHDNLMQPYINTFLFLISTSQRPAVTQPSEQKAPLDASLPNFTYNTIASGETRQGEWSRQVARRQLDPSWAAVPWKGTTGRCWSQTGPDVLFPEVASGSCSMGGFLMRRGLLFLFVSHPHMQFGPSNLRLWCCCFLVNSFCLVYLKNEIKRLSTSSINW